MLTKKVTDPADTILADANRAGLQELGGMVSKIEHDDDGNAYVHFIFPDNYRARRFHTACHRLGWTAGMEFNGRIVCL